MPRALALLLTCLLLAGCAEEGEDAAREDAGREARGAETTRANDSDADGIPDARERALADACEIAGRPCAELGIEAPTVGVRDLVVVQVGRSGHERDWRYGDDVWESATSELANLSIALQVADVGRRDDIDVRAGWENPANDGRFWHLWVLYEDPATVETQEMSGTQEYDLITLAERGDPAEERATLLHELYHALLGDLDGGHSACADKEVGGPGHSADETSVLYTSPDCETGEAENFRLAPAELRELREDPFDVLTEMNGPGWAGTPFRDG